jgi:lysylphosphatidylglycerol synthetase-like protein (DUF2156 family)
MAKSKKSKSKSKGKQSQRKERGIWLNLILVVMVIHGIFAAYIYYVGRTESSALDRPWILTLMVIHFIANVVAAVGIWFWKKWALYVYAASTVLALVVGLISVGIWSVFYMVLPLAIVGWVLRNKWEYFT